MAWGASGAAEARPARQGPPPWAARRTAGAASTAASKAASTRPIRPLPQEVPHARAQHRLGGGVDNPGQAMRALGHGAFARTGPLNLDHWDVPVVSPSARPRMRAPAPARHRDPAGRGGGLRGSSTCAAARRAPARPTPWLRWRTWVEAIDAVVLSGGSVYGLAAADGVAAWLGARRRGYQVDGCARSSRRPRRPGGDPVHDLANGVAKDTGASIRPIAPWARPPPSPPAPASPSARPARVSARGRAA